MSTRKIWRDNSSPVYWLGLGAGVGLLLPTLWVQEPLTQVTTGWSILVISLVGLVWIPVGDYARRRIPWLPDPPERPSIVRAFVTTKHTRPPDLEDGDYWFVREE